MARLNLDRSGPWIGWGGLVCLLWICGASVLLVPWWVVLLMLAMWSVCALLVLGWSRIHPVRVAYVPLAGLVLWFALALLANR